MNTKRKPVFHYYFIMDPKTRFFQFCFKFQTTPLSMEGVLGKNTRFIAVTGSCSTYENSNATQREETPRWREGKSIRYVNWEAERLKPNEMRRQQKRVDHFQYIFLHQAKVITYNNDVRTFFPPPPTCEFHFPFFLGNQSAIWC
jgi:hypothetical protein